MRSARFGKTIVITDHARDRMVEHGIDEAALIDLVESGELRYQSGQHLFIFKQLEHRHDNLVCAATVDEAALVIKTVMVDWKLRGEA